jgi:hypothetical protein
MKRLILALLVSGMVFGVVFGAAAALGVTATPLQAGGETDLVCDDSGVDLSWNVQWNNAVSDHVVGSVQVGSVDEACNGSTVLITLTKNGNWYGQASTTKVASTDPSVSFGGGASTKLASDITDVHIAIFN